MSSSSVGSSLIGKSAVILTEIAQRGPRTASELADVIAQPPSSTFRLISALEQLGWVERTTPRSPIRLGITFIGLGHALESSLDVRRRAATGMKRLHRMSGLTVFLMVQRDEQALCVEYLDGHNVSLQQLRVGDSFPLSQGIAAVSLLAHASPSATAHALRSIHAAEQQRLLRMLDHLQRDGVAAEFDDPFPGITTVASPILGRHSDTVAVLAVSGLTDAVMSPELSIFGHLTSVADEISNGLGFQPSDRFGAGGA